MSASNSHRAKELRVIEVARKFSSKFRGLSFPNKRGLIYKLTAAVEELDKSKKNKRGFYGIV